MSKQAATSKRVQVKIDANAGHHGTDPVVEIVLGPYPYLWIGDEERCYGTISGAAYRKLRSAFSENSE